MINSVIFYISIICGIFASNGLNAFYLRENLAEARKGDYIVAAQNKNLTLLHIQQKNSNSLTIEEVSIPATKIPRRKEFSWKNWMDQGAPGNSSWMIYKIETQSGHMLDCYSVTAKRWCETSQAQNFLTKMLNLQLELIPDFRRRKVGSIPLPGRPDRRKLWQPRILMEGLEVHDVICDAWIGQWPKDQSELSERMIEIYLPSKQSHVPRFFPLWLEISALLGNAKMRIIEMGSNMHSHAAPEQR